MSADDNDNGGSFYTGTEPFLAVFTQTQVVLSGVRLTFDEQIAHNISDLGPQIENARRTFVHTGDVVKALQDVGRIAANYRQRLQAWENEANRREQNKSRQSGEKIAKMKAEHSRVRNTALLGMRSLSKLEVELHQLSPNELRSAHGSRKDSPLLTPNDANEQIEEQENADAIPDEVVRKHKTAITGALKKLLGDGLLIAHSQAKQLDDDRAQEQAWDSKLPLMLIAGWSLKQDEASENIHSADYKLRRKSEPARRRDVAIWLVPKSRRTSASLSIVAGQLNIVLAGRDIDACRLNFMATQYSEMLNADRLPKSAAYREFLGKINEKVFDGEDETFWILRAEFNNLELSQNQLMLRVAAGEDQPR